MFLRYSVSRYFGKNVCKKPKCRKLSLGELWKCNTGKTLRECNLYSVCYETQIQDENRTQFDSLCALNGEYYF
jgi:hypothetical protein